MVFAYVIMSSTAEAIKKKVEKLIRKKEVMRDEEKGSFKFGI